MVEECKVDDMLGNGNCVPHVSFDDARVVCHVELFLFSKYMLHPSLPPFGYSDISFQHSFVDSIITSAKRINFEYWEWTYNL